MIDNADYIEIKKKVRKLKKLEMKIRFGDALDFSNKAALVWNDFFNLKETSSEKVKYSMSDLVVMSKAEYHDVVDEFFYTVYFKFYKENGIHQLFTYDPEVLAHLGLPYNSDYEAIKKKFRELSKKYHPDNGGDSSDFIKLTDNYKKLVDSN